MARMKIRYSLQISPEKAFHMLADFKKFGALHPYMNQLEGEHPSFKVYETVPLFGVIPIHNQYDVFVQSSVQPRQVIYHSPIKKSVSLTITWTFPEEDKAILEENIHIEAHPVVRWILSTVIRKAHRVLIGRMNAC
jgi:carbon monoxide dehydrogenase subunit G